MFFFRVRCLYAMCIGEVTHSTAIHHLHLSHFIHGLGIVCVFILSPAFFQRTLCAVPENTDKFRGNAYYSVNRKQFVCGNVCTNRKILHIFEISIKYKLFTILAKWLHFILTT